MRLWIIIALAAVTLGCRSTDSSSRREIALLRTEILDLEDQYYSLKSRCAAEGMPVGQNYTGVEVIGANGGQYFQGDTLHTGFSSCPDCGNPVHLSSGVIEGTIGQPIYDNGYYGNPIYEPNTVQHPTAQPSVLNDPVLSGSSSRPVSPQTNPSSPEVIQGREIVDPLGQPFEETISDPTRPSGQLNRRPDRDQRLDPGVRNQKTARTQFVPDPRFSDQNYSQQAREQLGSANRTADGWVQNLGRDRNNVDLSTTPLAELAQTDRQAGANQFQSAWKQSSTQRRTSNDHRGNSGSFNSNSLSSQPLDDRFLDQGFDEFSDFANAGAAGGEFGMVKQIFVDPEYTYGRDFDNDGEQDGISLLIQPLDEQGRVVALASDLVVSLIDPSEIGEKQRIGLWKYESYQVESFVSNQRGQRGLVLELPWQRRVPKNDRLLVFVRYTAQSGERLETSLDVRIVPPDSGYELEIDDNVVNRGRYQQQGSSNRRSVPTTAGNPVEVPKWRPVR